MNTPLVSTLQDLLRTGEKLIPQGGSEFSGYNAKRQSKYLLWRKRCLDAIGVLNDKGAALLARLMHDENVMYFYQTSAQKISAALTEALEIARALPEPAPRTAAAAPAALQLGAARPGAAHTPVHWGGDEESTATLGEIFSVIAEEDAAEPIGSDADRTASADDASPPGGDLPVDVGPDVPDPDLPGPGVILVDAASAEAPSADAAVPSAAPMTDAGVGSVEAPSPVLVPADDVPDADDDAGGVFGGDAELVAIDDELAAAVTPVAVFSSAAHPVLTELQKFFRELSIECTLFAHTGGNWDTLDALNKHRPLPRYGVFLLSEEYRAEELMALGYLAGKYPWLTLSCIHHHTIHLPALLPGITEKEFVHALDEIQFSVMKELKTAGYSVSL